MQIFWGKVRKGRNRGKKLGFPTANIALHEKVEEGVYISQTKVGKTWHSSLTFIGAAKTFGEQKIQAEMYILDFNQALYGQRITIKLLNKLRNNKKFISPKELVNQMKKDEKEARSYLTRKSLI